MKIRYINFLFILSLLIAGACGESSSVGLIPPPDDDLPISQREAFVEDLTSSPWNVGENGTVTRDNVDVSDQFVAFVLTFNEDFTYTSTGGGDLWPDGSGSWQFVSNTGIGEILVGGVEMSAVVSASQLALSFNIADPEGAVTGRVADLTGGYIIIVIR